MLPGVIFIVICVIAIIWSEYLWQKDERKENE